MKKKKKEKNENKPKEPKVRFFKFEDMPEAYGRTVVCFKEWDYKCCFWDELYAVKFLRNVDPDRLTEVVHINGDNTDLSFGNLMWMAPDDPIYLSMCQLNYGKPPKIWFW